LDAQPPSGTFGGPVPTVRPGAAFTVYGHWYTSACNDTVGHDPLKPLPPVHVTLTLPDGDVRKLGAFDPHGKDMGFSVGMQVPATTRPGLATVRDDRRCPAVFTFEIGS
jgi:hypothetical protein